MISLMGIYRHERFQAANHELRVFLRRVEGLVNGAEFVTEAELTAIQDRMLNLAPEVGDASRSETLDGYLLSGIEEYVRNFRALQQAVEKIRCVVLGRRLQLEIAKRHRGPLGNSSQILHHTN